MLRLTSVHGALGRPFILRVRGALTEGAEAGILGPDPQLLITVH